MSLNRLQGYVEKGGVNFLTSLAGTTADAQRSYPGATVTVYQAGTLTLATIYSDTALTAKSNPFTAAADGLFDFYTLETSVDVKFDSGSQIWTRYYRLADGATGSIIDVADFGATASGTAAANTTAITAAIAALSSGSTLRIAGNYTVNELTCAASNIVIEGPGTLTSPNPSVEPGNTDPILTLSGNNVTVKNLFVTGTGALTGTQRYGILFTGTDGHFDNVRITGVSGTGLVIGSGSGTSGSRTVVTGGRYYGNGYAGLDFNIGTVDVAALTSSATGNGGNNGVDGYGITFHSTGGRAVGNYLSGNFTVQLDCHGSTKSLSVESNTIELVGTESTTTGVGISVADCDDVSIAGNIIAGTGLNTILAGIFAGPGGSASQRVGRINVVDNKLSGFIGIGVYVRPKSTTTVFNVTNISSNQFRHGGSSAIIVDSTGDPSLDKSFLASALSITDNQLFNSNRIFVDDTAQGLIENNRWHSNLTDFIGTTPVQVTTTKAATGRIIRRNNTVSGTAVDYSPSMAALPTTYSWRAGDIVYYTARSAGKIGAFCDTSGTFAGVATTGNSTINTAVITAVNPAHIGSIVPGDYLSMAGVTWGGASIIEVLAVDVAALTVTVAGVASASTVGAAITWPTPVFTEF